MAIYRYQHGDRPLEGFTIQHGLGRGGFGEVYYAVSDAGREVALKAVQNYEDIELRGIKHCMNLKHPQLVSIFDIKHTSDSLPFVIMEYIDGPSLRDILDSHPDGLGSAKAAFFLQEIAKGMSYLHDCGVVHRDLKPHNVFYENGVVKIGDYSLSKAINTSHRSGHTVTVGTVHYMAPEISMGRYDHTVDIYALGVMLYEMLKGHPPFLGSSMGEVLMKHVAGDVDVSSIEQPFQRVIKKALSKEPHDRYQSAQAMIDDLMGHHSLQNSVASLGPETLTVIADQAMAAVQQRRTGKEHDLAATTPPPSHAETASPMNPAAFAAAAKAKVRKVKNSPWVAEGKDRFDRWKNGVPEAANAASSSKSCDLKRKDARAKKWILRLLTFALVVGTGIAAIAFCEKVNNPIPLFVWTGMWAIVYYKRRRRAVIRSWKEAEQAEAANAHYAAQPATPPGSPSDLPPRRTKSVTVRCGECRACGSTANGTAVVSAAD